MEFLNDLGFFGAMALLGILWFGFWIRDKEKDQEKEELADEVVERLKGE